MKIFRKIPDPITWEYNDLAEFTFTHHDFFLTSDNRWEYVDNIEEAEIVPFLPPTDISNLSATKIRIRDDQIGWVMSFFIIDDHHSEVYYDNLCKLYSVIGKNIVIAHKNLRLKSSNNPKIFYYDSMFNVSKLYFTDYKNETLKDKLWSWHVKEITYNLPDIATNPTKKFINASYIYPPYTHPRMKYRKLLLDFLEEYKDQGYIGSFDNRLLPNEPDRQMMEKLNKGPWQWYPLADEYYQNSYLSIVVETVMGIERNQGAIMDTKCVTEKTLEPLVKGNFVLPFGYPGLIQDILDYGFRLPDWIDYSYDKIEDPDLRFERFLKSVKNVLSIPIDEMMNVHYYKDKVDILEYNRQVFFDRPYDDLYTKLEDKVRNLPR